ncbi:MAG: YbaK/EbsC family protein [Acidimicrobiia bacterium]
MTDTPALRDARLEAVPHDVVTHGPVSSLEEAADVRGLSPRQVTKTIVVRRAEDEYLFVLVPGDRVISWPKLRRHLGVSRLSMPDADDAERVTGYAPGTITPFGAVVSWPIIADRSLAERVSVGGGARGVSITIDRADLVEALDASIADVTDPK